jgi:hypothetical protein
MAMDMTRQRHIGQDGHAGKQLDVLESSADTDADQLVRMQMRNVLAVENNLPLLRMIESGNAIEQTGFACAVRPYDTTPPKLKRKFRISNSAFLSSWGRLIMMEGRLRNAFMNPSVQTKTLRSNTPGMPDHPAPRV